MKIKESEKINKYLDLVRELRKLWNMRVSVTPIKVGALGMDTKDLKREQEELYIRGRIETSQNTVLKLARVLRRVLSVVFVYIHYTNEQLTPLEFC